MLLDKSQNPINNSLIQRRMEATTTRFKKKTTIIKQYKKKDYMQEKLKLNPTKKKQNKINMYNPIKIASSYSKLWKFKVQNSV